MSRKKEFFKNIRAVSPIIAVILMVAITVVLAATIYAWVSGFGGGGGTAMPAITLKQIGHDNTNVTYRVIGAENAVWGELKFMMGGDVVNFTSSYNETGGNLTGGIESGKEFVLWYWEGGTNFTTFSVGDTIIVIHTASNKQIYETKVTTA